MILKYREKTHCFVRMLLSVLASCLLVGCGMEASAPEPTAAPAPTEEPRPEYFPGYMSSENGLFYPERSVTEQEIADILLAETGESFRPGNGELSAETFRQWLETVFEEEQVADALRQVIVRPDGAVNRAEAVVCLNTLFDLPETDASGYFPDVSPEHWAYEDILLACTNENPLGTAEKPLPSGEYLLNSELYMVDDTGYFLKNTWCGALCFGFDGRYTSGNTELDGYVTETFRALGGDSMDRETLLKAAYDHVRDDSVYLVRNYYEIGDVGWAMDEALTMYATGKGNCYSYASAFWAAARALGWNAKAVSGTYGEDEAPHGWVEIYGREDGACYTYDPEIEMKSHLAGNMRASLFAMTEDQRSPHDYEEYNFSDDFVPRRIDLTSLCTKGDTA